MEFKQKLMGENQSLTMLNTELLSKLENSYSHSHMKTRKCSFFPHRHLCRLSSEPASIQFLTTLYTSSSFSHLNSNKWINQDFFLVAVETYEISYKKNKLRMRFLHFAKRRGSNYGIFWADRLWQHLNLLANERIERLGDEKATVREFHAV